MEIYVQHGEVRLGPYLVFQLRDELEKKHVAPEDLAWYQGLEAWVPLAELDFVKPWLAPHPPPLPDPETPPATTGLAKAVVEAPQTPERLSSMVSPYAPPRSFERPHSVTSVPTYSAALAWKRLGARVFDSGLCFALMLGLGIAAGQMEFGMLAFPPFMAQLGSLAGWVFIEALLLHYWGITPGKFLFGLHVISQRPDGPPTLALGAALKRSVLVYIWGMGFGLGLLMQISWLIHFFFLRRNLATFWDQSADTTVVQRPMRPAAIIALIGSVVFYLGLQTYAFLTAPVPEHVPKEQRQAIEGLRQMWETLPRATQPPA